MAAATIPGAMVSSAFHAFNIKEVSHKEVNGTPILASILVPKNARPGKHAVTVRWHGGGLATGQRLYADWYLISIIMLRINATH